MYLPKEIEQCVVNMQCYKDKEGKSNASVFQFYDDNKTYYLKAEKRNEEVVREQELYQWLKNKLPVPKVICEHSEGETEYLLIEKVDGIMLESDYYRSNPELLVKLAADGIKLLQGIDISHCPFDSTIGYKLKCSKERIESGQVSKIDRNEYTEGLETPQDVYEYLITHKPIEDKAFTHGDFCFNNYFASGQMISGFIDFGRGGVGDKYQDIALCVRELWDFDKKYTQLFFDNLGIVPDYDKIKYYILLDELF
jgi:aminoglycoside 3'-phosphotransferase-3